MPGARARTCDRFSRGTTKASFVHSWRVRMQVRWTAILLPVAFRPGALADTAQREHSGKTPTCLPTCQSETRSIRSATRSVQFVIQDGRGSTRKLPTIVAQV